MLKIDKKADGEKYTTEEVAMMPVEEIKKMIEVQMPNAFAKKSTAKKPAAKKTATKKKAVPKKKAPKKSISKK